MNYTPNLNLKKPAKTDPVLIDDLNDNMDILDILVASWVRVDTLSAPVLISEATYENQASIPITVPNTENRLFAIEFRISLNYEEASYYILTRGNATSTGIRLPIGTIEGKDATVRKIGSTVPNRMNFYFVAGEKNFTGSIYIGGIYLVKEGL